VRPHLQILVVFKEPVARRILFQALRKERHPLEQPVPDGQLQHPAERQAKPGASSGCNSRPGKGNEPLHLESSLGLMEVNDMG